MNEPVSDIQRGMTCDRGNPFDPEAVNLHWPEIMRAIAVGNFGADPARFLIAQSPKRALQP